MAKQRPAEMEPAIVESALAQLEAGSLSLSDIEQPIRQRIALWRKAGVSSLHAARLVEFKGALRWPNEQLVARVTRALWSGGIVAIIGDRGPGKSQYGAWAIREFVMRHGLEAKYWRADDLFDQLRSRFGKSQRAGKAGENGAEPADEARRMLNHAGLVVIDEVHGACETAWERQELERIIDHRYGAQLATLLIANLDPSGLGELLGPSTLDRMHERGGVYVFDWASFRRQRPGEAA